MSTFCEVVTRVQGELESAAAESETTTLGDLLNNEQYAREALMTAQAHSLASLESVPAAELSAPEKARLQALYGDDLPQIPAVFSQLVGIEGVVIGLMRYLQAAQFSQELLRTMLVFRGPTGSGKSTFLDILLENFRGFTWVLDDCPIHESALHALKKTQQLALAQALNLTMLPGTLCTVCQERLLTDADKALSCKVRRVPLHLLVRNPHITLTGDRKADLSLLVGMPDKTGVQSGGLIRGNAGVAILSGLDAVKTAGGVRQVLHDAIYDRHTLCPAKGVHATASVMHIAVANGPLFPDDAAMRERQQEIVVPYNISPLLEAHALASYVADHQESLPCMPHVMQVAGMMAVYTRLERVESTAATAFRKGRGWDTISPEERMALYDGRILVRKGVRFAPRYAELFEWQKDGFTLGISFRQLCRLFSEVVAELMHEEYKFVTPYDMIARLEKRAVVALQIPADVMKGASKAALHWYHTQLVCDLTRATYPKQFGEILELAAKYLAHLDALRTNQNVKVGDQEEKPDEGFLMKIEEAIGVRTPEHREAFRSSLGTRRLGDAARNGGNLPPVHPILLHAVEQYLYMRLRENIRSLVTNEHPDREILELLGEVCGTVENPGGRLGKMGYLPESTRLIVRYAKKHVEWEKLS